MSDEEASQTWPFDATSGINQLKFTHDGKRILFTRDPSRSGNSYLFVAPADAAKPSVMATDPDGTPHVGNAGGTRAFKFASREIVAVGDDRAFGLADGRLIDLDSGKLVGEPLSDVPLERAGYLMASKLVWGATPDGAIHYWEAESGVPLLTLYTFPGNKFFAVSPGGRYDTNLGPDSKVIRWRLTGSPWESFAPQTFMRDRYVPGLYRKILECREQAEPCVSWAPGHIGAIANVNRVLPDVRIVSVEQGDTPLEATVTVEVNNGHDREGGAGTSGMYNLRLFRNGKIVAMTPEADDVLPARYADWSKFVADWQKRNVLPGKEVYRHTFAVPLPTGTRAGPQVFSAYAFNDYRVKSETATAPAFTPRRAAPRRKRAFVINIGINGYDTDDKTLHYSVRDARLMGGVLSRVPGFDETRQLVIAGELVPKAPDSVREVSRQTILEVLSLVTRPDPDGKIVADLRAKGIDARALEPATPDDIVIVTFSGHGDTDKDENFYLIPSDGTWAYYDPDDSRKAKLDSLVSSADISNALRGNQAGEIALIMDACRSAASIEAGGTFKPGPMGDAGLGQLAYDKGVLILAAAQRKESAIADGNLSQGLLTYSLAARGEGLSRRGDLNDDGKLTLDEWLRYAVQRMPSLIKDRRKVVWDPGSKVFMVETRGNGDESKTQEASLFDFNPGSSLVTLRTYQRAARLR